MTGLLVIASICAGFLAMGTAYFVYDASFGIMILWYLAAGWITSMGVLLVAWVQARAANSPEKSL